jgi:hypothetical protein
MKSRKSLSVSGIEAWPRGMSMLVFEVEVVAMPITRCVVTRLRVDHGVRIVFTGKKIVLRIRGCSTSDRDYVNQAAAWLKRKS